MSDEDRVAGTLLGKAAGDALGAGYEFATPPRGEVAMIGGGLGTSVAIASAEGVRQ